MPSIRTILKLALAFLLSSTIVSCGGSSSPQLDNLVGNWYIEKPEGLWFDQIWTFPDGSSHSRSSELKEPYLPWADLTIYGDAIELWCLKPYGLHYSVSWSLSGHKLAYIATIPKSPIDWWQGDLGVYTNPPDLSEPWAGANPHALSGSETISATLDEDWTLGTVTSGSLHLEFYTDDGIYKMDINNLAGALFIKADE